MWIHLLSTELLDGASNVEAPSVNYTEWPPIGGLVGLGMLGGASGIQPTQINYTEWPPIGGLVGLGMLEGASNVVTPPEPPVEANVKVGGDDVPIPYEVWEKRVKPKKHDEVLDKVIRDAYDRATGKTPPLEDEDDEALILAMLL
jgi:hypothetical protein